MSTIVDEELATIFTAVEPTGYIVEIQRNRNIPGEAIWQPFSIPTLVTLGSEVGARAIVDSTSTLPASFRTTMSAIRPDGSIATSLAWEEEFGIRERKYYDLWFVVDQPGDWSVEVIMESVIPGLESRVVARKTVGLQADGEELPKVKLAWVAKWIGVPLVFVGIGLAVYYFKKQTEQ